MVYLVPAILFFFYYIHMYSRGIPAQPLGPSYCNYEWPGRQPWNWMYNELSSTYMRNYFWTWCFNIVVNFVAKFFLLQFSVWNLHMHMRMHMGLSRAVKWVGLTAALSCCAGVYVHVQRLEAQWLVLLGSYSWPFTCCLQSQRQSWIPASAHSFSGRCPVPSLSVARFSPLIQPASSSPQGEPTLPVTRWSRSSTATLISSSRVQCLSIPVQLTQQLQRICQSSPLLSPVLMKSWDWILMNLVSIKILENNSNMAFQNHPPLNIW